MDRILMYGAEWCPDCRRAKSFLTSNGIEFEYHDIELDEAAVRRVEEVNRGKRIIPTFEILGETYTNPDNPHLAAILGVNDFGRIVFYGADWCPDCRRAKAFLDGRRTNYQFIDIDRHPWAAKRVEALNEGKRIIPTLLIDGTPHVNPDNARLQEVLGLEADAAARCYDVIVVGAGAAGLTTAIYTQREKMSTAVLERRNIGGNAFLTSKIENYPGFTDISGPELMDRMAEQARTYGATIEQGVEVRKIVPDGAWIHVETNMGDYEARSVVLALGSTYRRLEIPGEEELIGAGVHFCATCDGPFYRGKRIIVVGGGNSAVEEGLYLTEFCEHVTFVARGTELTATETLTDKLATRDNVTVLLGQTPEEFLTADGGGFAGLRVRGDENGDGNPGGSGGGRSGQGGGNGKVCTIEADGAFIFIGLTPNTGFLEGQFDLDERGFIQTAEGTVQTNVPGVFAAGDCRQGAIAQIAAATGEGVLASFGVKHYLRRR